MTPAIQKQVSGMLNPVFRMIKSLYGHPQAGKFWEEHLIRILVTQGWEAIEGMKSCYVNHRVGSKLGAVFLCVYVDDFIMAGKDLAGLWKALQNEVKFGADPVPLDRFLGVKHTIIRKNGFLECTFDMSEFAGSCVDRFCELTNTVRSKMPKSDTPAHKELPFFADNEEPGYYASVAPSLLMKPLYLARCARPELSFVIARLARRITRWTRADDRAVDRLYSYLNSSVRYMMSGRLKIGCGQTFFIRDSKRRPRRRY